MLIITALLLLGPALALALPASMASSGELTYFNPGLGACGRTNGDGDLITAVSASLYDRTAGICDRSIRVHKDGRSVDVRVADRCGGCADSDLDLSPEAFERVAGGLGVGRTDGTWEFI